MSNVRWRSMRRPWSLLISSSSYPTRAKAIILICGDLVMARGRSSGSSKERLIQRLFTGGSWPKTMIRSTNSTRRQYPLVPGTIFHRGHEWNTIRDTTPPMYLTRTGIRSKSSIKARNETTDRQDTQITTTVVAYRQGCRVGRSAGTCKQQQPGAVRIETKNINAGGLADQAAISRFRFQAAGFRVACHSLRISGRARRV